MFRGFSFKYYSNAMQPTSFAVYGILIASVLFSTVGGVRWKPEAEGRCPRNYKVAENLDEAWMNATKMPYKVAASKYHVFRITTNPLNEAYPDYRLYYESCPLSDFTNGTGTLIAYGQVANTFDIRPVSHGVIDFVERRNPHVSDRPGDTSRHYITLTDNKSFVFFANCWLEADQRSWDVISTTDKLSLATKRLIEEHAISLGFDPEKFAFLRYDNCRLPVSQPKTRSGNKVEEPRSKSGRKTPVQALYGDHGVHVRLQNFGWQI